jgi:hypothetical protein
MAFRLEGDTANRFCWPDLKGGITDKDLIVALHGKGRASKKMNRFKKLHCFFSREGN